MESTKRKSKITRIKRKNQGLPMAIPGQVSLLHRLPGSLSLGEVSHLDDDFKASLYTAAKYYFDKIQAAEASGDTEGQAQLISELEGSYSKEQLEEIAGHMKGIEKMSSTEEGNTKGNTKTGIKTKEKNQEINHEKTSGLVNLRHTDEDPDPEASDADLGFSLFD